MFRFAFGSHFTWEPIISDTRYGRPKPGDLIALQRQAYRVVAVSERPVINWDDKDHEAYEKRRRWHKDEAEPFPAEELWEDRPYALVVRPAQLSPSVNDNDGTLSVIVRPYICDRIVHLPEHYAVCGLCAGLMPCQHLLAEREAARQAGLLELKLSVMPGCCWSCREVITKRQKSIAFDGPNLEIPGGIEPVMYHLRRDCLSAAMAYEERWVAADPGARQLRLRCPGFLHVHLDGPDCDEGPLCVGSEVPHKKGWSNHTYYVRHETHRKVVLKYVDEHGVDDQVRDRALQSCTRCADALKAELGLV